MPLVDLNASSWKELLSITIQGVVAVVTVGITPWFGYKTFLEKNKIEDAKQRLKRKTTELDKIKQVSQAAKLNIELYQRQIAKLEENLLNIQVRAEAALEFTEISYSLNEKLNTSLIEKTPPEVINHLSALRDQTSRQQRQLDSYYNVFKEISVFASIKEDE